MVLNVDFSTPVWLVNYYHSVGTISFFLNSYVLFLVLFKSDKMDDFKYYLLAFQTACFSVDVHLTVFMQPQPLHPISAGFCTGVLALNNWVSCHSLMTIMAGLIAVQFSGLTLCFFRKFLSINTIGNKETALWIRAVVMGSFPIFTAIIIIYFILAGKSKEEEYELIRRDYPQFEQGFRSVTNFGLYELDIYWKMMLAVVVIEAFLLGNIIFHSTKGIYKILGKFKSKMSVATYRKHRMAIMSLIAQLITSLIGVIPPMTLAALLIIEFEYAQITCRILLMIFSTHASVNAIVLVVTTPSFRNFTMVWKRGKTTPLVVGSSNH